MGLRACMEVTRLLALTRLANFQFNILNQNTRDSAMNFLDSIPDNFIVIARNISGTDPATILMLPIGKPIPLLLALNNSLYHRLKSQGFVLIDSFNRPRHFVLCIKKIILIFCLILFFQKEYTDKIELSQNFIYS